VAREPKKVRIKMSKKRKQQTILESVSPYLLMRARNITRNEEKLKELEVKEKMIRIKTSKERCR